MATDAKFVIGQIVKLKSGGPDMTVHIVPTNDHYYYCQWFAGKKLEQGRFSADALELVQPENQ